MGEQHRSQRSKGLAIAGCVLTLLAAGCSSSSSPTASATSTTPAAGASTTTSGSSAAPSRVGAGHPCGLGATRPKAVASVLPLTDVPAAQRPGRTDVDITSFDGAKIYTHWFPTPSASQAKPAPTVLMGPGWSLNGDTVVTGAALFSAASIGSLRDHGYNVVTWDPRGFGRSGGLANVDDPRFEGRDVQALIDWVAEQPQAQLDRPGDPRVGMIGDSYGGGIQLSVAAIDCRVDAIVPGLAWHSLHTSLYKNDTVKVGWSKTLYQAAVSAHARLDPTLVASAQQDLPTGHISPAHIAWYEGHGPGAGIDAVDIPTLFVSGTVDTLFTLDEVITNYESLRRRGVPADMMWFCGGHGTCLTKAGDTALIGQRSYAWLDRYLKGNSTTATGPGLDLVDQDGVRWTAPSYPVPLGPPVTAVGTGRLSLIATGGSGPLTTPPPPGDILGGLVTGFTPAKATNAVDVSIDPGKVDGLAIGPPQLTLTYSGTAAAGTAPERVFAQLVDEDTNVVVGNQVTPIPVVLDGATHTTTIPLEVIAQHLKPGHTLTLQIVATTVAYSPPRLGGQITFSRISISIPVAKHLTPSGAGLG